MKDMAAVEGGAGSGLRLLIMLLSYGILRIRLKYVIEISHVLTLFVA